MWLMTIIRCVAFFNLDRNVYTLQTEKLLLTSIQVVIVFFCVCVVVVVPQIYSYIQVIISCTSKRIYWIASSIASYDHITDCGSLVCSLAVCSLMFFVIWVFLFRVRVCVWICAENETNSIPQILLLENSWRRELRMKCALNIYFFMLLCVMDMFTRAVISSYLLVLSMCRVPSM